MLDVTHCYFGGWASSIFAHYEEDQGDLRCASLVPQQFSPSHVAACPRNAGIWLLDVINCTGETLSNALSHLYHFRVTLYMSLLQTWRLGPVVLPVCQADFH